MAEEQTLEVTIQNIVFQSDQGTFCVFRGENRDLGAVSVVYKGIAPFAGEKCALLGRGLNILVLAANLIAAHGKPQAYRRSRHRQNARQRRHQGRRACHGAAHCRLFGEIRSASLMSILNDCGKCPVLARKG